MSDNNKQNNLGLVIPGLPETIPFDAEQKNWMSGFFAGLHSKALLQQDSSTDGAAAGKPLTIIYGSQTGNAESVAELAAEQAANEGLSAQVLDMDDVTLSDIAAVERLLVITSTYGEGEMPDNAQALWDAIEADDAPSFSNTHFSVLALGDTSYDGFCVAGKMWDDRLAELGGQRVTDRVDCDIDFDEPSEQWIADTLPEISARGSQEVSGGVAPKSASGKAKSKFNRKNPIPAILTKKKVLTGTESSKEICHFEFSLGDSGEVYEAGDALNVISENRPDLIAEILQACKADGETVISGEDKTLNELLKTQYEIRTPSRELVAKLAEISGDEELNRLLENNDPESIADFLWAKDCVTLLTEYAKDGALSIEAFIALCKPLAPRAYSISSSINKHDNEVHLTIGSVRYQNDGREQNGVCSTYLADIAETGETVHCYFSPNKNFSVPENTDTPIIMVGPGTGIAPFRAFLEEREASGATGENWLFFGDRNAKSDFIYEDEIGAWRDSGLLTRIDLAFSRDQEEKIYVQNRMLDAGAEMFAWFERGAYFYICGDAYRMAKDVDAALTAIVAKHGNLSEQEANDYIAKLKKEKRYVRDVY